MAFYYSKITHDNNLLLTCINHIKYFPVIYNMSKTYDDFHDQDLWVSENQNVTVSILYCDN